MPSLATDLLERQPEIVQTHHSYQKWPQPRMAKSLSMCKKKSSSRKVSLSTSTSGKPTMRKNIRIRHIFVAISIPIQLIVLVLLGASYVADMKAVLLDLRKFNMHG